MQEGMFFLFISEKNREKEDVSGSLVSPPQRPEKAAL